MSVFTCSINSKANTYKLIVHLFQFTTLIQLLFSENSLSITFEGLENTGLANITTANSKCPCGNILSWGTKTDT